ncbi:MAG: proline/glycine betaine ABC transporter ATP-binding protein ProV [Deltaproteobacteria bacterium HGW-Deltaproteobacteria-4]|nr:MAG: proline/glycine betaine ABC transporter ATP-binding protein ProV [Deltaproteobacteria bacterium HGW-Deltaproteobacteria-4]
MEEKTTKIKVVNVTKIFGPHPKRALKMLQAGSSKETIHAETGTTVGVYDASFEINAGEIFVIMGLSGSGKSTMVRILNRLIEPTAGSVFVDGDDVATMNDQQLIELRRKKMCMVFQSFALMPHLTVLENAAFGLEISGIDKMIRSERALKALEQVGLEGYAASYPRQLSGGMQQRVGLARALAVNPDILLMDEAFSALDPLIRTEMQDELLKLQSRAQRTIVFISHDLDEAMRIGDRIAIMEGGRVVQVGTPEEILQNPADDYVRAFFRGVDPTNILTAGDIARKSAVTIIRHRGEGPRTALQRLISHERDYGYVLDSERRFMGLVSTDSLKEFIDSNGGQDLIPTFLPEARAVLSSESMQDILPEVTARPWPIPVLDEEGRYLGVISKNQFLRTLQRGHEESAKTASVELPVEDNAL